MSGTINITTDLGAEPQVIQLQLPGAPGAPGPQGIPGQANVVSIGTVTTSAPGTNASATITGVSPNQTLNLTIPQGPVGATGPANTLTIGTVNTVDGTTGGSATITGTAPNQTLNLVLPRGYGVNPGGVAGDVLLKNSGTDYDVKWSTPTSSGAANTVMLRDASGRAQVVNPSAAQDIATKTYVDTADSNLQSQVTTNTNNITTNTTALGTKVQIGGDLGGTIAAPTVTGGTHHTHTSAQISDATYNGVANKVMMTDASGNTTVNLLSLGAQQNVANSAARKDYVDGQDAAFRRVATNAQAATAYTFALTDEGKVVYYNTDNSAVTYTIPTNATVAFPTGAWIDVYQGASGAVTIQGAAGVSLRGADGSSTVTLRGTYSKCRITKSNTDTWQVVGDIQNISTQATTNATASPTAGALVKRDASGRAQVVDPAVAADIATKNYVDTKVTGAAPADASTASKGVIELAGDLGGTAAAPTVVGGTNHAHTSAQISDATAAATANTIVLRDATGSSTVATLNATTLSGQTALLAQQSADPAAPTGTAQAVLYKKSTGLWTRSQENTVVRRIGVYWGAGTAFPSTGMVGAGDTYLRTDIGTYSTIFIYGGAYQNGLNGWLPESVIVCTSTTRPSGSTNLFVGMSIFETDTKLSASYDGANWQYTMPQVQALTPASGWANWADGHATDAPVYERLQITRLGTRRWLNGMVTATSAAGGQTTVVNLAAADRPTYRISRRSGLDVTATVRVDIDPNTGNVTLNPSGAMTANTDYVYLDLSWSTNNNV